MENHQHSQLSLQTPERKRALKLSADRRWDRLGMQGCREGRHEEGQEEGGAPRSDETEPALLPHGREQKLYTLKKVKNGGVGVSGVVGGVHIVYM